MAYARAQTIMLLSCKKVCFWLQVREKRTQRGGRVVPGFHPPSLELV